MNKSITFLTDKEVGRRSSLARSLAFPESLLWANKSRRPFLSPEKNKTHNDLCHFFQHAVETTTITACIPNTHLDHVPSLEADLVRLGGCEGEESHGLHADHRRKETSTSWMKTSECSCVIGARRGEGTPSQDDIISTLSAWRRSLASCSLVNEESFLSACVSPFYHVTAARSERTRGATDWCLLTQSFDGACPQGKSAQGGRDG